MLAAWSLITTCSWPPHPRQALRHWHHRHDHYWTETVKIKNAGQWKYTYYFGDQLWSRAYYNYHGQLEMVDYFDPLGKRFRRDTLSYQGNQLWRLEMKDNRGHTWLAVTFPTGDTLTAVVQNDSGRVVLQRKPLLDRGEQVRGYLEKGSGNRLLRALVTDLRQRPQLLITYSYGGYRRQQLVFQNGLPWELFRLDSLGLVRRHTYLDRGGYPLWQEKVIYRRNKPEILIWSLPSGRVLGDFQADISPDLRFQRWRVPYQAGSYFNRISHQVARPLQSLVRERTAGENEITIDWIFPVSRLRIRSLVKAPDGTLLRDTLFAVVASPRPAAVQHYDQQGRLVTREYLNRAGERSAQEDLQYLPDGRLQAVNLQAPTSSTQHNWYYDFRGEPALEAMTNSDSGLVAFRQFYRFGGFIYQRDYDGNGSLRDAWWYLANGDTLRRIHYTWLEYLWVADHYDGRGKRMLQERFTADSTFNWQVYFDSTGHIFREEFRDRAGIAHRIIRYDYRKHLQAEQLFDITGAPSGFLLVKKDSLGRPLWERHFDEQRHLQKTHTFIYDSRGLTREVMQDSQGKKLMTRNYHYNPQGQMVKVETFDADSNLVVTTALRYEGQRLKLRYTVSPTTGTTEEERYLYDDHGKLIGLERYTNSKLQETLRYVDYPAYGLRIVRYYNPEGEKVRAQLEPLSAEL